MNLAPTEEQQMIARTARDFAERELAPKAAARDKSGEFPEAELRKLAALGLMGVGVDSDYDGAGSSKVALVMALQEIARVDASVAVAMSVSNMVAELIQLSGSAEQKREYLPKLVSGEYLCGAFALSEPQAGSDPAAMTTRAEQVDGTWRISGTKQWITSGDRAGLLVVWAISDPSAGHRGISAFVVRQGAKGLSVSKSEDKMGLHGSTTVQLALDQVEGHLLGEVGGGFKLAMMALDGGRIGISAQACGVAQGALNAAVGYATEREQFGKPIVKHQAIGNMLADSGTWLTAAQQMTLHAAWRCDQRLSFSQEAAMAKLFSTEKCSAICDIAIQVHGGYGYTTDFPVERAWRDSRVTRIYEGTSEIQRIVIARKLLAQARGD